MEENSEKNQTNDMETEEQTLDWKDAKFDMPTSEVEDDLVKEAELIAKLTQEAGFGTPEYLKGTIESVEEKLDEDSIESVGDVSEIDFNADVSEDDVHYDPDSEFEVPDYLKGLDSEDMENKEENSEENKEEKEENSEENSEENIENNKNLKEEEPKSEIVPPNLPPEPDQWEELDDDNGVVKKYIFYVSKDFVPLMDSLSPDQRTAYINDAIQKKIDAEYEYSAIERKKKIMTHLIVMILTFFIVTPIVLFIVHKSIMLTFENYKYSQDNFEKLYKHRFEKDRAYMRSIEYNRLHAKDEKKEEE